MLSPSIDRPDATEDEPMPSVITCVNRRSGDSMAWQRRRLRRLVVASGAPRPTEQQDVTGDGPTRISATRCCTSDAQTRDTSASADSGVAEERQTE